MNLGSKIVAVVLLMLSFTEVVAADPAPPASAVAAKIDHSASLSVLDSQLACFDALIGKIPDIQQRAAAKALSDGFKDRRTDLQTTFNHDLFLDLRWEIDVEYQRLIAWFASPTVTVAVNAAQRPLGHPIELLRPDPSNKADVQVALDVLDRQIQALDERARSLPDNPGRAEELTRISQIKEHRARLGKDFTKQHWDEVTEAINAQGNRPISGSS
jgi:hypothetical protein